MISLRRKLKLKDKEVEIVKAMAHAETAKLQRINEAIERENQESMEKLKDFEFKNEALAKKIEVVEETLAELQCKNRDSENYAKEIKAECDALKSKQAQEQIKANSEEVEEETEQEHGGIKNQCSKCNFIGKTEAGLKTHNTMKHVPLFRRFTKVQVEENK